MAVAVVRPLSVVHRVEPCADPAGELAVRGADTGVDDVHVHAGARSRGGVRSVKRERALVDAVERPRSERLDGGRTHRAVLLDEAHLGLVRDRPRLRGRQARREAAQHGRVGPRDGAAVAVRERRSGRRRVRATVRKHDHVPARDRMRDLNELHRARGWRCILMGATARKTDDERRSGSGPKLHGVLPQSSFTVWSAFSSTLTS
jgi:hypothetical protein